MSAMSGIVVSDYAGLIGPLAQKIAAGISDLWYREIPGKVYADPSLSSRMSVVRSNLTSLEQRFRDYLKPYLPNTSWNPFEWLRSFGTSVTLAVVGGHAQSVHVQLKTFERELSLIGSEWASITGIAKPVSTEETDVTTESGITSTAWELLKIGAIGLAIWYGGKYLYGYMEEHSRYPQDQLPRYAGGSRRKTRRKR